MIKADIVADSIGPSGVRLTTFVLTYPRYIHSEFNTHRAFSRNASSSRAIPVRKSIQMIRENPAIPLAFTKNQKGMQGGEALDHDAHEKAVLAWLEGRDRAIEIAEKLADLEVHKQYANRVLEPFAHITVVATATDWNNFFALRCHEAAQPEIHELADKMYGLYRTSTPKIIADGHWHLPFVSEEEYSSAGEEYGGAIDSDGIPIPIKRSVARCARVSYLNHDGTKSTVAQDLELYKRLLSSAPLHASPAEHQAMACGDPSIRSGNFRGWIQYRKTLRNENITKFEMNDES